MEKYVQFVSKIKYKWTTVKDVKDFVKRFEEPRPNDQIILNIKKRVLSVSVLAILLSIHPYYNIFFIHASNTTNMFKNLLNIRSMLPFTNVYYSQYTPNQTTSKMQSTDLRA